MVWIAEAKPTHHLSRKSKVKSRRRKMKRIVNLSLVAVIGFSVGAGVAHNRAQAGETTHKINICHGTASAKNPYVLISVDQNAVKGHLDGTAPGHGKNNYPDYISVDGTCKVPSTPPSGPQPS
jgi:hypothetical protein